ncbi:DUF6776 family protein [Lysobacter brunescens]|uniref:DUF6776 family protein n=1 Tax=Lysobacter brunescens TaxID=262323 RepID=A0ABW2Y8P8_9GAMM
MTETPDSVGPASPATDTPEAAPAVRALLDRALSDGEAAGQARGKAGKRRRKRRGGQAERTMPSVESIAEDAPDTAETAVETPDIQASDTRSDARIDFDAPIVVDTPQASPPSPVPSIYDTWTVVGASGGDWNGGGQAGDVPPTDGAAPGTPSAEAPRAGGAGGRSGGGHLFDPHLHAGGHHWVYVALAVFLIALGFGLWGAWTTFFSADADSRSASALRARNDRLTQEVSTLRRSDQISREANRDLERTLAERDEEIAGLRADIAFYERFVGATGQRRGLSVHDLDMRLQSGDVWQFTATLTQNLNRGAVNTGRLTLGIEGTRNDRLEKLAWSGLRKLNNAPGLEYSFKYFQQVEGEVMLPEGFKPLRVTVRLVPSGGSAVEQSFPWPDTIRTGATN